MNTHEINWTVVDRGGNGVVDIDAPDDDFGQVTVAMNIGPERARRIVACVNACAGFDTELLEKAALTPEHIYERERISYYTAELEQQRDKLLTMLKGAEALFACHCKDATAANWLDNTRALTAEIEVAS